MSPARPGPRALRWAWLAAGALACATPDPAPYLAHGRMLEAREGRPTVETPGWQHRKLDDGSVVNEVLHLPDGRVLRHGVERETYASGAKRAERHFERDAPTGAWTQWYEDGALRSRYVHGDEPSPMTFYGPDGAVAAAGLAERGRRTGPWRFYHPNGALAREGAYVDGRRHGEWREYDPDGRPLRTLEYVEDALVAARAEVSER